MKRRVVVVVVYVVVVWVRDFVGLVVGRERAGDEGDPLYIISFLIIII